MDNICTKLGIKRVFTPVYTPECNGKLEGWHKFFKACVAKHIQGNSVEWDELVPLAAAAYNFFPCQASKESPFVLMFGRDPVTPFCQLLEPAPRYWGDRGGQLKMDALQRMYAVAAQNIKWARDKQKTVEQEEVVQKLKVNDLVLVRDPDSPVFHPKYLPNFRVKEIHGSNRIVVQDEKGNVSTRRASHVKKCPLKDKIAMMVPTEGEYSQFGRPTKLLIHPKDVPDLKFPEECTPQDEEDEISSTEPIQCAEVNITLSKTGLAGATGSKQGDCNEKDEISSSQKGGIWCLLKKMGEGWGRDTDTLQTKASTFMFSL